MVKYTYKFNRLSLFLTLQEEQQDTTTKEINYTNNILEEISTERKNNNGSVLEEVSAGISNANDTIQGQAIVVRKDTNITLEEVAETNINTDIVPVILNSDIPVNENQVPTLYKSTRNRRPPERYRA